MKPVREVLLQCYLDGVARVRGRDAVRQYLRRHPVSESLHLVAIGKAAADMTLGALAVCDAWIRDGLVITKHGHLGTAVADDHRLTCIESDHPVPGENTLRAGAALWHYIKTRARDQERFLFLLSGGASSLVEVLPEGMSLNDLQTLNQRLLGSGLDIKRMNRARCALSRIKSGRLAQLLNCCSTLNLLISDVPGDDPGVIGSGLLTRSDTAIDLASYPQAVRELLRRHRCDLVTERRYFAQISTHVIACLDAAKHAAVAAAQAQNFAAKSVPQFLAGDARAAGGRLVEVLHDRPGVVHVWGGETTVTLPKRSGRGGRNQHLALAAAIALQGNEAMYLLAAGTDGSDGPTSVAGAMVDGASVRRGEAADLDPEACLRRADAGIFLEASGDLITTGPTGTNVMDLVLGFNDQTPG